MRDDDNDPINGTVLLIIGLILVLYLATNGSQLNSAPTNGIDNYNTQYHYETHTTNVDICGICINSNH